MNPDNIAVIEYGTEAWERVTSALEFGEDIRVYLDDDLLKIKIGQGIWSQPFENGTP